MKSISLSELHKNTGKWVRLAATGKEIIITDRGIPIAKIVPITTSRK